MSLPDLLSGSVGDERVVTRVSLGGDDVLVVTPTRTLVYRGDGLLSSETIEEYAHDAERLAVSTGRRKSTIVFGYGLDGEETLTIPSKRLDEVVHPILLGVLSAHGITDPDESIVRAFRFSELTLVVTDHRLVKHVGAAVWDEEFEEFPYDELTDLYFEQGTVATTVVLEHSGRSERFKAPSEEAPAVRETLVEAVCAFHDVDDLDAFRLAVTDDDEADAADDTTDGKDKTDFGEGPDPLSASPVSDAARASSSPSASTDASGTSTSARPADTRSEEPPTDGADAQTANERANAPSGGKQAGGDGFESPFERPGVTDDDLLAAVTELQQTVEAQSAAIDRQSNLIEQLIEELRQGR